jgi:MFS family permease
LSNQNSPWQRQSEKPVLFYGYIIVATSFLIQIIAWGMFNAYGVFFSPLLTQFGWSRATVAGALSLSQILIGIGAIFLGNLNDRFGPRILMTSCGILAGLGYLLMSQINSIWQLYLFHGVIVGIGLSGTDVVLLSTTARWFIKRRGVMSGIVKMGTGTGIMIMPLFLAWLILDHGWRGTYAIMGAVLFVLVVSGAQLLRRDPAQMRLLPYGEATGESALARPVDTGLNLGQACRTRRFWMLCLAYLTVFFCTLSIIVHIATYVGDIGLPASFGAIIVSIIGGASILGRLIMGITADRIGSKGALLVCFAILIAAFSWLQVAASLWALSLFALAYGFCHGGFYVLTSTTVAEFFGTRSHGLILGIVIFSGSVGGSIGPIVTGYIFDTTASYQAAFILFLALAIIGFILILEAKGKWDT